MFGTNILLDKEFDRFFPGHNTDTMRETRLYRKKVDLCPPCGIKYNRLLKVESITNEMNFIISNHDINSSFPCIASAPNGTMKSDEDISSLIHSGRFSKWTDGDWSTHPSGQPQFENQIQHTSLWRLDNGENYTNSIKPILIFLATDGISTR